MTDTTFRPKSRTEQLVESQTGRDIADLLRDLYHERGMSQQQIADELRVSRWTVVEWMKRYAIPTGYNRSEAVA